MEQAAVAVLLVSPDFLASSFIVENELPPPRENASDKGTIILPIVMRPCRFASDEALSVFQSISPPDVALSGMDDHGPETVYDSVAMRIEILCALKDAT
jgi:hypothetical protein